MGNIELVFFSKLGGLQLTQDQFHMPNVDMQYIYQHQIRFLDMLPMKNICISQVDLPDWLL